MRVELEPFGIRVVLIEPGVVATPLYAHAQTLATSDDDLGPYAREWPHGIGPSARPTVPRQRSPRWTSAPRFAEQSIDRELQHL
jgi:NAD(P)-dependent dehydrogenase (short-subunit alcohol dehydrogenase family)